MNYCTQQDMIERFGEQELIQLTDRADPPTGGIDGTVLDKAIADASAFIDGYLAKRYRLPLADVPPFLARLCCQVARYYLHDDAAPEEVRERYKDAERTLLRIAKGEVILPGLDGAEPSHPGDSVQTSGPDRIFTNQSLGGF